MSRRAALFKNYITPEGEERIKTYKYQSQTDSLVYGYIMGPLANLHIKYFPSKIAPNVITFFAFLFNIIPHLAIIFMTNGDLSLELPRWMCALTGICQFLYMHFDNMDGKQARKTNSSSSLGMLYDHGLDSISGWIMALNFASIVRMGNGIFSYYTLIWVPLLGFYFTMWEEYCLNFLNFGYINPVDEGLSLMNMIMIFTGIVGPNWWMKDAIFGLQRNQFLALSIITMCFLGIIRNVFSVIKKKEGGEKQQSLDKLKISLFLILCLLIIQFFSPSNIVERRTRSLVTCFGLGFCKVIGHIQLAHCAGDEFYQWRKSFLFSSAALIVNTLIGYFTGKFIVNEDLLLSVAIAFNLGSYLHYIMSITQQLTRVLDIKAFSIKKKQEKVQ